jgi:hypothetical protein
MSMLIGNSVIISAIKLGEQEGSPALNKALTWAGLALCVAWGIMDWQGWNFSHTLIEDAREAAKNLPVNPYLKFPTTFGAEIIFYCAMSVVAVFFLIYIWLLRKHGWWRFWKPAETKAVVRTTGTA